MDRKRFERLVAEALDLLPTWVAEKMNNLEVIVEERPSKKLCKDMGIDYEEGLLGLYQGPWLPERDADVMAGPSRVTLYRRMIASEAENASELPQVIRETLAHEIGHHFGMTDAEIEEFEAQWEKRRIPQRRPHSP